MRYAWAELSPVNISLIILSSALQLAAPPSTTEQITANATGLDMVPAECSDDNRQRVLTDNLIVLRNKVISFNMGSVTVRSELRGATVYVSHSDGDGVAFFPVTQLIRYRATDVRLYHAILDGRPVILWEETVENVSGRAGLIEYRGRGLFPICDGRIRVVNHDSYLVR